MAASIDRVLQQNWSGQAFIVLRKQLGRGDKVYMEGLKTFPEVSRGIELDTLFFGCIDMRNDAEMEMVSLDLKSRILRVDFYLVRVGRRCSLLFREISNVSFESDGYLLSDLDQVEFESMTHGSRFFASNSLNLEIDTNAITVKMHARGVSFLVDGCSPSSD